MDRIGASYAQLSSMLRSYPLPLRVGWGLTALIILVGVCILRDATWDFSQNYLANIGQFLSGVFAPLAFLWLVIAVLLQTAELGLQREELKQSREALQLQAAETRALVEQNKLSVDVANKTLAQQQLREREARLHQIIDALGFRIMASADHSWATADGATHFLYGEPGYLQERAKSGGRDAVISAAVGEIVDFIFFLDGKAHANVPAGLSEEVELLLAEFERINTILENEPELETVRVRAYALDLLAYVDGLKDVLTILGQLRPKSTRPT